MEQARLRGAVLLAMCLPIGLGASAARSELPLPEKAHTPPLSEEEWKKRDGCLEAREVVWRAYHKHYRRIDGVHELMRRLEEARLALPGQVEPPLRLVRKGDGGFGLTCSAGMPDPLWDAMLNSFLSGLDPFSRVDWAFSVDALGDPYDESLASGQACLGARLRPSEVRVQLEDDMLYIAVEAFRHGTAWRIENVLSQYLNTYDGVVIDLRNNPGGLVAEAADTADLFLRSGLIASVWDRDGRPFDGPPYVAMGNGGEETRPLVVLVNRCTASAAEVLAQALSGTDYGRALVVGERTFGKGSLSEVFRLSSGRRLLLTTGMVFTASGSSPHFLGIEPDFKLEEFGGESDEAEEGRSCVPMWERTEENVIPPPAPLTKEQKQALFDRLPEPPRRDATVWRDIEAVFGDYRGRWDDELALALAVLTAVIESGSRPLAFGGFADYGVWAPFGDT